MARESKGSEQFDVDGLRELLELMEKYDIREFKQQRGDAYYVLRRGAQTVAAAPVSYIPAPAAPAPTAAAGATAPPAAAAASADEGLIPIKSPTVGTFYQSPSPSEPAFIKVGDTVSADTVVCIVEAMKLFNKIPAKVSGTIAKVLLNDGDSVEFGQPMFLVKP
ncbi:acetyl-CoA carboxylase biotin carboxyl carrier protein [Planctomicrobium sp. SH527]|uniref:acetyl-CoA carboxylase biotin carboxyl carrier protein n=1 Tax=Planctomicrobium sp. SH527 TaxID=3448123 RepID=UPI003F5BCC9E